MVVASPLQVLIRVSVKFFQNIEDVFIEGIIAHCDSVAAVIVSAIMNSVSDGNWSAV